MRFPSSIVACLLALSFFRSSLGSHTVEVSPISFPVFSLLSVCGLRCEPSGLSFQLQLPCLPDTTLPNADGDGLVPLEL